MATESTTKIEIKIDNPVTTSPPVLPSALTTASAGVLTQVIKEKKKKKKKMTAKERAADRLEKSAEKFIEDSESFNNLLVSVSYWLKQKEKIVRKLLDQQQQQSLEDEKFKIIIKKKDESEADKEAEENNDGLFDNYKLSYDDFKLVTCDLDIPCTNVQLHVICKLLDPDSTKRIDYTKFTPEFLNSLIRRHHMDGIRFIKKTEPSKYLGSITFKRELSKHFAAQSPSYIKLDIRLGTFSLDREFKGHIKDEIVYTHTKVISLVELIKERIDVPSNNISIYQEVKEHKDSKEQKDVIKTRTIYLDESRTLESYGFTGGSYNDVLKSNEKVVLYYDYLIMNQDDPILKCDFYFHDYKFKK